jgi:phage antirepressor YoqD-like protein
MKNKHTEPTPRYKYKEEIAKDLGISLSTLKRWLIKEGVKIPRGYVSPENQTLIYLTLGLSQKESTHNQITPNEPK